MPGEGENSMPSEEERKLRFRKWVFSVFLYFSRCGYFRNATVFLFIREYFQLYIHKMAILDLSLSIKFFFL